ncbi:MAG: radical SAM protein [Nanoarchaeota archaeon]|nr:radical SAM protein [Nanoarchaeota archaeon]
MIKPLIMKGWDKDIKKAYDDSKLPLVTMNMTRECNFSCNYCHTDAGKADENEVTGKEWEKVIDESTELGADLFWIGGRGEPLLDKSFKEVIGHINETGSTTILNTNGTLINHEMATFLYKNNVSPEVKIISFDENVYDYMAGVSGAMPLMRKGIDNLLEAGYGEIINETSDARITRLSGMMLLTRSAYDSIPEVLEFCKENNMAPLISDVIAAGRVVSNRNLEELHVSQEDEKNLLKKANEIMGYKLEEGFDICSIQYGVFIQNNGDVIVDRYGMSCDVCDYQGRRTIDNIRENDIKTIWNNILNERERSKEEIEKAYQDFEYSNCFSKCPMMIQSQKDYFKI